MLLNINDTELMPALWNGESGAYEAVYRHFVSSIRLFVDNLISDGPAAEDITTESFIKTFQKKTDFKSIEKLQAYLYVTASNAALDHIRNRKRRSIKHQEIQYSALQWAEDVEVAYIRAEASQAIQEAIETLPPKPKEVIRMAFLQGKKLTEIADELNIAYNTVQNHRSRGLELLKAHLVKNKLLSAAGLMVALTLLEGW